MTSTRPILTASAALTRTPRLLGATPASRLVPSRTPRGGRRAARCVARRASRRSGIAFVYTALGLAVFLGITALVVDMGRLYTKRVQAQNAADSGALAGAYELYRGAPAADKEARKYAARNGYGKVDKDATGADVVTLPPGTRVRTSITTKGTGRVSNTIQVWVERDEPLYFLPAFAALLGQPSSNSRVGASATSEATFATDPIASPISLGAEYGATDGFANPSVFGRDARYTYGDAYSPLFERDGTTANRGIESDPRGADFKGYDYTLAIGADYVTRNGTSLLQMELFDPDTYVSNTADMLGSWDELHTSTNGTYIPTSTTFTLLAPKARTTDPDVVIATATYAEDAESNLKWTTPGGFTFDTATHGTGNYTLRVKGGAGTAENGFQFRAGRPHAGLRDTTDFARWKEEYNAAGAGNGTSFSARGKVVFNFTRTGNVKLNLGLVPKQATKVLIDKFDTDVGFQSIEYSIFKADANGNPTTEEIRPTTPLPPGTPAGDGQWATTDRLDVPTDYETLAPNGAFWYATYAAGAYDTSNWLMGYEDPNVPPSKPGSVRLVG